MVERLVSFKNSHQTKVTLIDEPSEALVALLVELGVKKLFTPKTNPEELEISSDELYAELTARKSRSAGDKFKLAVQAYKALPIWKEKQLTLSDEEITRDYSAYGFQRRYAEGDAGLIAFVDRVWNKLNEGASDV